MISEITFFGIDYIGEKEDLKKFDNIIWTADDSILDIIEDNKEEAKKNDSYILWDNSQSAKTLLKMWNSMV